MSNRATGDGPRQILQDCFFSTSTLYKKSFSYLDEEVRTSYYFNHIWTIWNKNTYSCEKSKTGLMEGELSKIYLHTQSHFSQTGASKTYLLRILITGNAYLSFLHSKVNGNISHIFIYLNVLIPFWLLPCTILNYYFVLTSHASASQLSIYGTISLSY